MFTMLLGNKLCLAPISDDVQVRSNGIDWERG